jgi:expansin (peptidoglycan-binding protein)
MRHRCRLLLSFLVVTACGSEDAQKSGPPPAFASDCTPGVADREGEATYYDFADGSGACGFDPSPDDLLVGAMNAIDYAGAAACGACVRLWGPNADVTIRVVDLCPECPAGNIDLSPEAFERVADLSAGRVPIHWRYVACDVEGPIDYHFKEGSNEWWTALQVRNHRYAIAELAYEGEDSALHPIAREDYNYFVEQDGMGPGPYRLRVTDVNGAVLEDSSITPIEAGDVPGSSQFPACGAGK